MTCHKKKKKKRRRRKEEREQKNDDHRKDFAMTYYSRPYTNLNYLSYIGVVDYHSGTH